MFGNHYTLTFLVTITAFLSAAAAAPQTQQYAEFVNFNTDDLLGGDDGLIPHPQYPLKYGAPVLRVDKQGNGIEEHAAHVAFFDGKYYLYTETWACGRILYFSGTIPGQSKPPGYNASQYPPGDNGGACGISTYSSSDLQSWTHEDLYYPESFGRDLVSKPRAFWSPGLEKYVLWFHSGNALGDATSLWVAISRGGPAGPWGDPVKATGDHLSHDYAITIGPDGTGWIVTDVWAGSFDRSPETQGSSLPFWSVWVQKLNEDMTGVVGPEAAVRIFNESHWEAIGIFHHEGLWYITSGGTCSNCEADIKYIRARDPLGPWFTEEGYEDEARLIKGNILSEDGCGSQAKGASVLPSPEGPIVVTWGWAYRTSPSNYISNGRMSHADNMQAISSQFWFRPKFDEEGRIVPYQCESSIRIPLQSIPNVQQKKQKSKTYQPDCRVRVNATVSQGLVHSPRPRRHALEFPVFQKTDDLGPFLQDGVLLNGPLSVHLHFSSGAPDVEFAWPAHNISHAPEVISVPISGHSGLEGVTLSTNATNGCYGVLVERKKPRGGDYSVARAGERVVSPKAQLFIHSW